MSTDGAESEQFVRWNGPAGRAWVDTQPVIDALFAPVLDLVVRAVTDAPAGSVLDVGCGTGSTTLAIARQPGRAGTTGIDISEPMLAAARARAAHDGVAATFVRADAASHPFTAGQFAAIVSRFGVMFFDDPVGAFANLRRAARPDARLFAIAWRGAADNPFMTTAERTAAPLLPALPPRKADGPGQFAFADEEKVRGILHDSGWHDIRIAPADVVCTMPETELLGYVSRFGPVGLALQDADEPTRARVVTAVRAAFEPFVHGSEVRFTAACWMISARG